jgi:pimeloyl-ACP methyl ester carboxylesterase
MTDDVMNPSTPPAHTTLRPDDFHRETVNVDGLKMHLALEGPEGGPLVVLLHGFPEFWYSWRYQIRALAAAGYRVAAPDQRGYNLTDKTPPYDIFTLANDIRKLVGVLGYEKAAALVGHDWGGGVAWVAAGLFPEVFGRLAVINCPHPAALIEANTRLYLPQVARSWYILFFQLPGLPERVLSANNYRAVASTLRDRGGLTLTRDELGYYREAWGQPGALSAGISWYRAMFRGAGDLMRRDVKVRIPVWLIWGEPDMFLTPHVAELSRKYCAPAHPLTIQYVPGGHFVQQTAPDTVNKRLLEFLS